MANPSGGPMETFWGQSKDSISAAIKQATDAAAQHVQERYQGRAVLEWFELIESRGEFTHEEPPEQSGTSPSIKYQVGYRFK
jgi:flavin-binding protein dodecin